MKTALHFLILSGLMALAGCQSTDRAGEDARTVRIEFTRPARIYESGDAIFAMRNSTSQVLWFAGQRADAPVYRLRAGGTNVFESEAGNRNGRVARFPLSPGEARYFEVNIGNAVGPSSIGVTFYPSFTGTNGTVVWSLPAAVPAKPRRL